MTNVQLLTGLAAALVLHTSSALADAQSQARAVLSGAGTNTQKAVVHSSSAASEAKLDAQQAARQLLLGNAHPGAEPYRDAQQVKADGANARVSQDPRSHIDAQEQARRMIQGARIPASAVIPSRA